MKAPAGLMIEVDAENIDEGRFLQAVTAAASKAYAELNAAVEATGQSGLKARVKLGTLELAMHKDLDDTVHITYSTPVVVPPSVKRKTLALAKGGRILSQPGGPNKDEPRQMRMFTTDGKPAALVDVDTWEVVDEAAEGDGTAGKIGGAAG